MTQPITDLGKYGSCTAEMAQHLVKNMARRQRETGATHHHLRITRVTAAGSSPTPGNAVHPWSSAAARAHPWSRAHQIAQGRRPASKATPPRRPHGRRYEPTRPPREATPKTTARSHRSGAQKPPPSLPQQPHPRQHLPQPRQRGAAGWRDVPGPGRPWEATAAPASLARQPPSLWPRRGAGGRDPRSPPSPSPAPWSSTGSASGGGEGRGSEEGAAAGWG
jgi:hypothetical protein